MRPAPGRVLLMDQDVLHRVSTPSRAAGVPRYSLVLKLCFYPKEGGAGEVGVGGGGGALTEVRAGAQAGGGGAAGATQPTLARGEWGAPLNFGTAGGRSAPPELLGEVYRYSDDAEAEDCDCEDE